MNRYPNISDHGQSLESVTKPLTATDVPAPAVPTTRAATAAAV